jgi:hypothetical protein
MKVMPFRSVRTEGHLLIPKMQMAQGNLAHRAGTSGSRPAARKSFHYY